MSEILTPDTALDTDLTKPLDAAAVEAELSALAERYRAAGGLGIQILNLLGGSVDGLLDKLPAPVRSRLDGATEQALQLAMQGASGSRRVVPDQPSGVNRAVSAAMGAAGGMGGLPGALVELPATTAFLLRSIQGVAAEEGFDPEADGVRFDCIRVFAAAGPLAADDGADLGFLSLRLGLTGGAVQKLIAQVAPRFSVVLGQKLAAQTVPVLGAVAGATTNFVYAGYYQEMARVHFGLRRLAVAADQPHEVLVARLQDRLLAPR
ncbi:EcsC family protein [Phaeobacter gallaeciensis]|uniref:EcsC family protein n=1 Tax=Phaeobacter gallaeciensis TaxID=60890 RepID=UPI000BBC8D59|nr:EcsC family protein [Phaeobacter gallaeciensis]ATF19315.1 EcsC protein family protein [Phaeobacter gallaeciensis]ATF23424.1 EcsC protein family protein [Phaeobacter gallaeciensis]